MEIKKEVGLRIKELREKCDLTQEDLALKAGLDRTYINSIENGRRNVSIINLHKIVSSLDLSLSDFFNSSHFSDCPSK